MGSGMVQVHILGKMAMNTKESGRMISNMVQV